MYVWGEVIKQQNGVKKKKKKNTLSDAYTTELIVNRANCLSINATFIYCTR